MRILRPDIEWGARGYLPIKWEMEQLISYRWRKNTCPGPATTPAETTTMVFLCTPTINSIW
uniref:Uncharacterized protein n=1 Tax=Anguilla anguilla TaxID=7936 RepID=A0A0E9TKP7_ANGAN